MNKGRNADPEKTKHVGEDNPLSIITELDAIRILQWPYGYKGKLVQLARDIGITKEGAQAIRSGYNWKHLFHFHSKFGRKRTKAH